MSILDTFEPLLGQLAWNVRKGHGTALLLEFGLPHRYVREPRPNHSITGDATRDLSGRRRVFIVGDWSLLILHAAWHARSGNLDASSTASDTNTITKVMSEIDGQALIKVQATHAGTGIDFEFDLGGSIAIRPSTEAADQWSLHHHEGLVTYQTHDGRILTDRSLAPQ